MPATLAELMVAAKDGIGDFLTTTGGLRPADEVAVRTASIVPEAVTGDTIVLGDLTAAQTQAGLATRQVTLTMPCAVMVTRAGDEEAVIRATRARAADLMAKVEAALRADASAAGTVTNPGRIVVTTSGLEESPAKWREQAARRADIPFTLSWTAHITG